MSYDSSIIAGNPWPHLSDYINFVSKSGEQIVFDCKLCLPKETQIKVHKSSLNNLKQHMKRVHEPQYLQFAETVKAGSNRGKPKTRLINSESNDDSGTTIKKIRQGRQMSIAESFGIAATGSGVPQARVEECIDRSSSEPSLSADSASPEPPDDDRTQ
ncbi:hypothetical protein ACJJTC_010558 [Scirpophaga incertulas]